MYTIACSSEVCSHCPLPEVSRSSSATRVALLERETSGKGQWLHTSLLQAMVYMMDFQTSRWLIDGEIPGQAGNYHPTSIPTGVYLSLIHISEPTRLGMIS